MGDDGSSGSGGLMILGAAGLLVGGALVVVLLVAIVLAPAALIASGSSVMLSGAGCPPPSAANEAPVCVNPDANAIVAVALAMAAHLYNCGSTGMDLCYDAGFPGVVLAYWQRTCPRCGQWANGNLQCVMLALAAYGLAGIPPPVAGNAVAFWSLYANRAASGWVEVPAGWGSPPQRGLPQPGDWMVWYDARAPDVGHIAVVVRVEPPTIDQEGSVTFAEANGPGPIVTQAILPDLTVRTWSGYTVVGYIRHI
jgi:CHAP domain